MKPPPLFSLSVLITGTAYIEAMINYDDIYSFPQTNNIIFEPGARSSWHTHGGSANTSFAHTAVNTNPEMTGLEWFERITDEEYAQLETEKNVFLNGRLWSK